VSLFDSEGSNRGHLSASEGILGNSDPLVPEVQGVEKEPQNADDGPNQKTRQSRQRLLGGFEITILSSADLAASGSELVCKFHFALEVAITDQDCSQVFT